MRVALAAVLFARPDVLLLDEPTNYLDLEGAIWLETFLARYPHTVLVISHDRDLLNRSVGAILHLDRRKLTLYQGPYDTFEDTRRARLEQLVSEKRKQDAARAHMQAFVDRFRAKASKARQAQSRIKALERMKPIAAIVEDSVTGFNFPTPEELSPPIIRLEDVSVGYGGPPDPAPTSTSGSTRTTASRCSARTARASRPSPSCSPTAWRRWPGARSRPRSSASATSPSTRSTSSTLDETPLQHLARLRPDEPPGKLRGRLAAGGIGADIVATEVGRLSGGQKSRLALLLATLDAPHLIILDEPTNHLDIESRDALVEALTEYGGAVILISHDPHLVELVAERLWLVKDGRVTPFDDDMDAYRRHAARRARRRPAARARREAEAARRPAAPRSAPLRAEVARCEARVRSSRRCAARSTAASPTRCSIRAATARRSSGCRRSAPRSRTRWRAPRRCGSPRSSGSRRPASGSDVARGADHHLRHPLRRHRPDRGGAALRRADPGHDRRRSAGGSRSARS